MQNISFTSKINFVPHSTFTYRTMLSFPRYLATNGNVVTQRSVFTKYLCDCTALFFVSENKIVNAFHFFNNNYKKTSEHLEKILDKQLKEYNVAKGLVIGGKDLRERQSSLEVFQRVLEKLNDFSGDVSVFKNQQEYGCTDVHYSPKKDTYTIYSHFGSNSFRFVESVKNLKKAFKKIYIAPQDELYIKGELVSKEKYPELFRN